MAKKYLPRNINEVITWSRNQVKNPTQDWTGLCQSHCRQAYGVPAWAPSAIAAWHKIPEAQKQKLEALPPETPIVVQVPVKLGTLEGNRYPLLSGLAAGDQVVVSNTALLRTGMPVKLAGAGQPGVN